MLLHILCWLGQLGLLGCTAFILAIFLTNVIHSWFLSMSPSSFSPSATLLADYQLPASSRVRQKGKKKKQGVWVASGFVHQFMPWERNSFIPANSASTLLWAISQVPLLWRNDCIRGHRTHLRCFLDHWTRWSRCGTSCTQNHCWVRWWTCQSITVKKSKSFALQTFQWCKILTTAILGKGAQRLILHYYYFFYFAYVFIFTPEEWSSTL